MSKQFHFKQYSLALLRSLNVKTYLFQAIQFSIITLLVLFDPEVGPYQVLPFQARMDVGAMALKRYSAFPKAPE